MQARLSRGQNGYVTDALLSSEVESEWLQGI